MPPNDKAAKVTTVPVAPVATATDALAAEVETWVVPDPPPEPWFPPVQMPSVLEDADAPGRAQKAKDHEPPHPKYAKK